jgi:hypothetical protein
MTPAGRGIILGPSRLGGNAGATSIAHSKSHTRCGFWLRGGLDLAGRKGSSASECNIGGLGIQPRTATAPIRPFCRMVPSSGVPQAAYQLRVVRRPSFKKGDLQTGDMSIFYYTVFSVLCNIVFTLHGGMPWQRGSRQAENAVRIPPRMIERLGRRNPKRPHAKETCPNDVAAQERPGCPGKVDSDVSFQRSCQQSPVRPKGRCWPWRSALRPASRLTLLPLKTRPGPPAAGKASDPQ